MKKLSTKESHSYSFFINTIKSLMKDIKDIFTISDKLIKKNYTTLKYSELIHNLKNKSDKINYEIQFGDHKKAEQKLKDVRISFYKLPRFIRKSEKELEKELTRLEQSVEIGFLVDQATIYLEMKKFVKAQRLLDTVSHYAFLPEGVISEKYFDCSKYYEHFITREQYNTSLKKAKYALFQKRLSLSIKNFGRVIEISKKLSRHEDSIGKQSIHKDLNSLQEHLHFLFLRTITKEKIKKIKPLEVDMPKAKLYEEKLVSPEYKIHFDEKLKHVHQLLKKRYLKNASKSYYDLVEFYNDISTIENPKIIPNMYSELIKLKSDIESNLLKKRLGYLK